ncbi:transglycosylase SLT domain-containing protein [Ectorhizobium quercum]
MRGFATTLLLALLLAGCATAPTRITNACAIFDEKGGLFDNWRRQAHSASREYGVPVPVLMATIYTESGFRARARPQRKYVLGIIPWGRASTAYGYAQALDGTWADYKRQTGRWTASRTNFGDAVRFVAWYHATSARVNGVRLNDTYSLYLNYYYGHRGYASGKWRSNPGIQQAARRSANMANNYAAQLRNCS